MHAGNLAERNDQAATSLDDRRWAAVLGRDPNWDDRFVYGVRTTGVWCRPSSAARRPRRENVEFFDSIEAAEAAGYRASRRALGDQASANALRRERVARACRNIETADPLPSLAQMAAALDMSPHHFHRMFKAETGLTPKEYVKAERARRLREGLAREPVTRAMLDAGFGSSSGFYADAPRTLGMQATRFRQAGAGTRIRFALGLCSLGSILVAQSELGVCAITLGDDPARLLRELQDQFRNAELIGADADFEELVARVVGFVESPSLGLGLPLDIRGTAFQQRVWKALQAIPAGETRSYAQIAEALGMPQAARAVAQACAANTIAVAIPCHRVVRHDGTAGGYRWGVARKEALIAREKSAA